MSDPLPGLRLVRIYDLAEHESDQRILVDRLWPRGVAKSRIDHWSRELAPSDDLRRWYNHDPARWEAFRERYFAELDAQPEAVEDLLRRLKQRPSLLLFASRERALNNAFALRDYLQQQALSE